MDDIEPIELKILSLARQGRSRVEFKRNASEIICRYFSCSGLDIYINEGNIDYTWQGRVTGAGNYDFTKAHEGSMVTEEYRRKLRETEGTRPGKNSTLTLPININDNTSGLLTFLREQSLPFTKTEISQCKVISGVFEAAISFRNIQAALRERIKELSCLYEITKIMQKVPDSIDSTLQEAIKNIPCAFQYEDIATSRIIFDKKEYICGKSTVTPHSLSSDIIIAGRKRGHIEVMYKPQGLDLEETPFLLEEQHLLDGIAKQLSLLIEEQEAAEEKKRLEGQLRHADRLATIGQLAAGVAHEINEPLANILGFSELIKKDPGLTDQTYKDLDKIIKASMFARETVKKLLVFASQIQPGETETDLNEIVAEGIQFFEIRCKKENIEVTTDLHPSLPKITADPGQLNQVLINLFVNAMQAMPEGGKIYIETGVKNKDIFLSIQDSGTGIDDGIRDKIFLPFFTTKETGKGTGLGLAVAHGIVHAYNGTIEFKSRKENGTNFTVYLPIKKNNRSKEGK